MTDQQRYDQVGYAGSTPVRTPNLDRLAASGVIFDNAYSGSTTCVPAGLVADRAAGPRALTLEPYALDQGSSRCRTPCEPRLRDRPDRQDALQAHAVGRTASSTCGSSSTCARTTSTPRRTRSSTTTTTGCGRRACRTGASTGGSRLVVPSTRRPTRRAGWSGRPRRSCANATAPGPVPRGVVPAPAPADQPTRAVRRLYDPEECVIDPEGHTANAYLPASFRRATAQDDAPHRRIRRSAWPSTAPRSPDLRPDHPDRRSRGPHRGPPRHGPTVLFFTSDHGDYAGHRGLVRKVPWIPFEDLARVPFFVTGAGVAGGRHAGLAQSFDFATTCLDYAGVDVDLATFDGISLVPVLGDPGATLDAGPHGALRDQHGVADGAARCPQVPAVGLGRGGALRRRARPGRGVQPHVARPGPRDRRPAGRGRGARGRPQRSRTCPASTSPPAAETGSLEHRVIRTRSSAPASARSARVEAP